MKRPYTIVPYEERCEHMTKTTGNGVDNKREKESSLCCRRKKIGKYCKQHAKESS